MAPISAARTPNKVRISFHGKGGDPLIPGRRIGARAYVTPPSGPVEPYGFDFRRYLWFFAIGGVGYSRDPPQDLGPSARNYPLESGRAVLVQRLTDRLEQPARGLAIAMLLGDRAALDPKVVDDLRAANLAHLLAISGLHMGLLCGIVFASLRVLLIGIGGIARADAYKKWAALCVCIVGGGYWALSGGSIATTRAYIMALIVFGAVLLNRRALTLRAVAVAALIILAIWPESLTSPGFQMSFAATIALVVCYRTYAAYGIGQKWPRAVKWVLGVAFSSCIAGAATAPFSAAHFNHFSPYGVIANLAAVPVVGALVMPAGLTMLLLLLVGFDAPAALVLQHSLDWVAWVAEQVASWPGAQVGVSMPAAAVLPMLSIGLLWFILWQGALRWMGMAFCIWASMLWVDTSRPLILIEEKAGLVGVATPTGRAISRARGAGFVARIWLENDADDVSQETAHARAPGDPWVIQAGPYRIIHARRAEGISCAATDMLILQTASDQSFPCRTITKDTLKYKGSLGFYETESGLIEIAAQDITGHWPWSDWRVRRSYLKDKAEFWASMR